MLVLQPYRAGLVPQWMTAQEYPSNRRGYRWCRVSGGAGAVMRFIVRSARCRHAVSSALPRWNLHYGVRKNAKPEGTWARQIPRRSSVGHLLMRSAPGFGC
jgi:hypothetical protein